MFFQHLKEYRYFCYQNIFPANIELKLGCGFAPAHSTPTLFHIGPTKACLLGNCKLLYYRKCCQIQVSLKHILHHCGVVNFGLINFQPNNYCAFLIPNSKFSAFHTKYLSTDQLRKVVCKSVPSDS